MIWSREANEHENVFDDICNCFEQLCKRLIVNCCFILIIEFSLLLENNTLKIISPWDEWQT